MWVLELGLVWEGESIRIWSPDLDPGSGHPIPCSRYHVSPGFLELVLLHLYISHPPLGSCVREADVPPPLSQGPAYARLVRLRETVEALSVGGDAMAWIKNVTSLKVNVFYLLCDPAEVTRSRSGGNKRHLLWDLSVGPQCVK